MGVHPVSVAEANFGTEVTHEYCNHLQVIDHTDESRKAVNTDFIPHYT